MDKPIWQCLLVGHVHNTVSRLIVGIATELFGGNAVQNGICSHLEYDLPDIQR